jgi:hypothetical protein
VEFEIAPYRLEVEWRRYELQLELDQNFEALKTLVRWLRLSFKLNDLINQLFDGETKEKYLKECYVKQISASKKLIKCLEKTDEETLPNHLIIALEISKITNSGHE